MPKHMPKTPNKMAAAALLLLALALSWNANAHAADQTEQQNTQQNEQAIVHYTSPSDDNALQELDDIVNATKKHDPDSLRKYRNWLDSHPETQRLLALYPDKFPPKNAATLGQLAKIARLAADAETYAAQALSNPDFDKNRFHDLVLGALAADSPDHSLAVQAVDAIADAWKIADSLVKSRETLLSQYHDEIRKGQINDGTRLAWSLIRVGAADPDIRVVPGSFAYSKDNAQIRLNHLGSDIHIDLGKNDHKERFRANVDGYNFRSGWAVLFQKPVAWMIELARDMRSAGVAPDHHHEWQVMEAPEGLVALAIPPANNGEAGSNGTNGAKRDIPLRAFYKKTLRNVSGIPAPENAGALTASFREAAEKLHDGIMADDSIPLPLRHALEPILLGTYNPIDKRDYFDNDFCRRLIEADYLESQVPNLSPERRADLQNYRNALAKIEAGIDRFAVDLEQAGRLVAVSRPEIDNHNGEEMDTRDPETGENLSPWEWRWERDDATAFHSPMPGRGMHGLSLLEKYDGRHRSRPKGIPNDTEVWHPVVGKLASCRATAGNASGDAGLWLKAVVMDTRGRRDGSAGPLGWNFPLFVPVRDGEGDPVRIATLNGTVESPYFDNANDPEKRRQAQDEWLDHAAEVLSTPGELALIYQIFFRYCSDSPLPEMPNLIGSHRGLSDTHQTVHQSLDRRWVGRLIGDCDDLAEFFQNLAVRQGKLAHVMQLPAHAAAGWLEEDKTDPEGGYRFVVLQTGPVLRFTSATREGAIEKAYRHFDDEVGATHFTTNAVPLLLRFADDDTRTAFVLSSRIYWDRDYAEKMIAVQGYWHLHTYSAAIKIMEDMIRDDREVGNLKELASLYEMVGDYEKSDAMRREEFDAVQDDNQAALSTLLDLAQLHVRDKNKPRALEALEAMEDRFLEWRDDNRQLYDRAMSFRSSWAAVLAKLDEPERAWLLLRPDVEEAWRNDGKLSDTMLRTLLTLYDRMSTQRDKQGDLELPRDTVRHRFQLREALARAFGPDYFKADDTYNRIHTRYFLLGRYGVAVAGRLAGLQALWADGPYPSGPRAHADRREDLSDQDWEWFRIMPRLYLAYGLEMLDREEFPDLYDPDGAKKCLELIGRASEKGAGFGSNVMGRDARVKGDLVLSFIDHDLAAFRRVMELVRGRDYSSLYDDAALVFGAYCGLIPENEFAGWVDAFHEFFPKRQHYFKAAYRALDKTHYRHAVQLARAAARFFPDDGLMVGEALALEASADRLRRQNGENGENGWEDREWAEGEDGGDVTSIWLRDLVTFE